MKNVVYNNMKNEQNYSYTIFVCIFFNDENWPLHKKKYSSRFLKSHFDQPKEISSHLAALFASIQCFIIKRPSYNKLFDLTILLVYNCLGLYFVHKKFQH